MGTVLGKAASVLIVKDDPFRVLMVKRRDSGQYASAYVFPGGAVETDDHEDEWPGRHNSEHHEQKSFGSSLAEERAYARAAVRETWEEVALLLGVSGVLSPEALDADDSVPFSHRVRNAGMTIALHDLHFFGHWVSPIDMPKRWNTRFWLAKAPLDQEPIVDGDEITEAEWIAPTEALARHEGGEHPYLFPTYMNLKRLAESATSDEAIERTASYPRATALVTAERTDAGVWRHVPEAAGYGAEPHWMPR